MVMNTPIIAITPTKIKSDLFSVEEGEILKFAANNAPEIAIKAEINVQT